MSIELIIALIAGVVVPIVLFWTGKLQSRISETETDLNKFMVKAAETYITKEDLNHFKDDIHERLDRLEKKIDSLLKANGR